MTTTSLLPTAPTTSPLSWDQPVRRESLVTLQLDLGRSCNFACSHCHIEAGPKRTEVVSAQTVDRLIAWMRQHRPPVVDRTGGAPELIPGFRTLVVAARDLDPELLAGIPVAMQVLCLARSAGCGSSCPGATAAASTPLATR